METITAKEFVKITRENPDWADILEAEGKPVGIVGYVQMSLQLAPNQEPIEHPIRRLSPLMHFLGETPRSDTNTTKAPNGEKWNPTNNLAAEFLACQKLKVAEGTFYGHVKFDGTNIERIDPNRLVFEIEADPDTGKWEWIASFHSCSHLEIAQGNFPGAVSFNRSGIKKIRNLPNLVPTAAKLQTGYRATFQNCAQLDWCEDSITQDPLVDLPRAFRIRRIDAMVARQQLAKGNQSPPML